MLAVLGLGLAGAAAIGPPRGQAQEAPPAPPAPTRQWQFTPSVTVQQGVTDNASLKSGKGDPDTFTVISPAIGISGRGSRARIQCLLPPPRHQVLGP